MLKCVFVFCLQASDLEGEIDLTKCFNVSEFQVQRNYGFQIHVRKQFTDKTSNVCMIETLGQVVFVLCLRLLKASTHCQP